MTEAVPRPQRRILVVGGTGMLGHACVSHLQRDGALQVDHTDRHSADLTWRIDVRRDLERMRVLLVDGRYDLVINAAGVLRHAMASGGARTLSDAIIVNALFPHQLAELAAAAGARMVHVSTDAVFGGRAQAPYDEASPPAPSDQYGASKWLGEPHSPGALTIRCSIVGRHPTRGAGLLDWFRNLRPGEQVRGYSDYRWSVATTAQVARLLARFADPEMFDGLRAQSPVFHFAPNPPISKCEFIEMLNTLRNHDVRIRRADHPGGPIDLTLATRFKAFAALSAEPRPWLDVLSEVWQ